MASQAVLRDAESRQHELEQRVHDQTQEWTPSLIMGLGITLSHYSQ